MGPPALRCSMRRSVSVTARGSSPSGRPGVARTSSTRAASSSDAGAALAGSISEITSIPSWCSSTVTIAGHGMASRRVTIGDAAAPNSAPGANRS